MTRNHHSRLNGARKMLLKIFAFRKFPFYGILRGRDDYVDD